MFSGWSGACSGSTCTVTMTQNLAVTATFTGQPDAVMHSFGAGNDGQNPMAGLVSDSHGNLYGTASAGGLYGNGTAFVVSSGSETVLYNFGGPNNDGRNPLGNLIFDSTTGNLYGTTSAGGMFGKGTVFALALNGTETVLYNFGTIANDGQNPSAGVVLDSSGNLWGTTRGGGTFGFGTAFELSPNAGGGFTETVMYSFGTVANDGQNPEAGLVFDNSGNLYGTTVHGGSSTGCGNSGCGTVFELSHNGTETVLYSFCAQSNCTDGANPYAGLVFDSSFSNLYGTTAFGGANGFGTAFGLSFSGGGWTEAVLYSFGNLPDGQNPYAGLVFDSYGNLFGTTANGGLSNEGAVFQLVSNTSNIHCCREIPVYGFAYSFQHPDDGQNPRAGLFIDPSGNLDGTTVNGGVNGVGTVFGIALAQYTLTVSTTGSGTVTSMDGSINCPGTCNHNYPSNTQVTLNATPASGYTFSGWSGACSGTGPCTVTMTQGLSVGATFTQAFTLTVSTTGSGTVTSSPSGINCPGTCSYNYSSGTHVTLSEMPATGYQFAGWGDGCSGTGSCTVTMNQNLTVDATFNQGGSFSNLLSFSSSNGAHLFGGVVQGSNGNLYGTTADGGAHSDGTVFSVTTAGMSMNTLYNFCPQTPCSDGLVPKSGLVLANDGNFYGTTSEGGTNDLGTVFQITPSGTLTTIYSFDGTQHGANPAAALIQGTDGNLYGTTTNGGSRNRGTMFKITTGGSLTVVLSFCMASGCSDGIGPSGSLIQGSDGNFYGTTVSGGAYHRGTIYKVTPSGTLTTLHSFDLTDGSQPTGGVVQGFDGNLYGTTYGGGTHHWGTVFKIATSGESFSTLRSFGITDGALPDAPLLQASDGNLYGTTYAGGLHDKGTVFEITTSGSFTLLYSFGFNDGGAHDFGTVFRLPLP